MSLARIVVSLAAGVLLLAPSAPPAHAGGKALRCAFAKQRAVVRKIESVLECQREALRTGASVDPACTAAATAKLVESFTRAEMRGGCVPEGDVAGFQVVADQCSTRIGVPLQGTCTEAGEECGGGAAPCCTGLVCMGSTRGGPPVCGF
jgi:hypothetical protein